MFGRSLNNLDHFFFRCQDTMIGGAFVRGVSGGERKRVSIGNEIIINPSLLLLDEPTSGLDSTTALRTIQMLHDIAEVCLFLCCISSLCWLFESRAGHEHSIIKHWPLTSKFLENNYIYNKPSHYLN